MRSTIIIISTLAAISSSLVSAWKCEMDDMRYLGQNATLIQTMDVTPYNSTVNMTISGTMKVVDACTFMIENFVFQPEINETYWYGIRDETYDKGMISNDTVHASNGGSVNFSFVDYPIARGWDDIDTLILISRLDNTILARAELNLTQIWKIRNPTSTSSGSGSGTSGTVDNTSSSSTAATLKNISSAAHRQTMPDLSIVSIIVTIGTMMLLM